MILSEAPVSFQTPSLSRSRRCSRSVNLRPRLQKRDNCIFKKGLPLRNSVAFKSDPIEADKTVCGAKPMIAILCLRQVVNF